MRAVGKGTAQQQREGERHHSIMCVDKEEERKERIQRCAVDYSAERAQTSSWPVVACKFARLGGGQAQAQAGHVVTSADARRNRNTLKARAKEHGKMAVKQQLSHHGCMRDAYKNLYDRNNTCTCTAPRTSRSSPPHPLLFDAADEV